MLAGEFLRVSQGQVATLRPDNFKTISKLSPEAADGVIELDPIVRIGNGPCLFEDPLGGSDKERGALEVGVEKVPTSRPTTSCPTPLQRTRRGQVWHPKSFGYRRHY